MSRPFAGLLAQLELTPQTEELLLSGEFSIASLGAIVNGGWEVHDHLEGLKVGGWPWRQNCSWRPNADFMHVIVFIVF